MNRFFSLTLLIAGIVLILYGVNASNSVGSDISRFFTGSPTDRTIWFLLGGIVTAVVGLAGMFRASKST